MEPETERGLTFGMSVVILLFQNIYFYISRKVCMYMRPLNVKFLPVLTLKVD